MFEIIENFVYGHFIYVYCAINIVFYLLAHCYRIKYFDKGIGKYKKSVDEDKVANILITSIKVSFIIFSIIVVFIVDIIKLISFNKIILYRYNLIQKLAIVFIFIPCVTISFFPIVLILSIIGIFGKYDVNM